ncbi:MAG: Ig domain-containing protein, partial [Wenzhouxiangellaceae bacterium]
ATFNTRTVSADLTDGDGGTATTVTQDIDVVPPIVCDGTVFANFCWWLGNNGESCDAVCADNGGNDPLGTTDFAGSGGSNQNCGDVMTALNADTGLPPSPTPVTNQAGTLGCASDFNNNAFTIRFTSATSAGATGTNIRRACACNDQPAPTGLSYPNAPFTFTRGIPIATQTPTVTNAVANWSISPTLPAGLNFDTDTGEISGTPSTLQSPTNHTVTASNAGGSAMVVISVEVQAQPPMNLDYPAAPFVFNVGNPISPEQLPTVTGAVDAYSISPALPAGITFNTGTGAIGGTPTATSPATNYTVTATNGAGSDMVTISITVNGAISCGGTLVGGFCWYFGANNQSCNDVCAANGGYNNGTETFAGSGGSNANCVTVLEALGQTQPGCTGAENRTGLPVGCAADFETSNSCPSGGSTRNFVRYTSPATTAAGSSSSSSLFLRRACACNN